MKRLLISMVSAALGLWLAMIFIPGVLVQTYSDSQFFGISLATQWHFLAVFGIVLGLTTFFVKPILDTLTLPLRIITLGLFGFFINMALLWVMDYIFRELSLPLFYPLAWTTIIIFFLRGVLERLLINKSNT